MTVIYFNNTTETCSCYGKQQRSRNIWQCRVRPGASRTGHTSLNVPIIYYHYVPLPPLIVHAAQHRNYYERNLNGPRYSKIWETRASNTLSRPFLGILSRFLCDYYYIRLHASLTDTLQFYFFFHDNLIFPIAVA